MVKKVMSRTMGSMILVVVLVITMFPTAVFGWETTTGETGTYSIKVMNDPSATGINIEDNWFHAYQILESSNLTTYEVHDSFKGFFVGVKDGGDNKGYNFGSALTKIEQAAEGEEKTNATNNYNQLVGKYLESYYTNDPYNLVVALREYVKIDTHNESSVIKCVAHDKATEDGSGKESVTLLELTEGYYFVLDEASTLKGVGVAASGALVPIGEDLGDKENVPKEVHVKNSIPAADKKILHNDLDSNVNIPGESEGTSKTQNGQWDIVGDYEIGDKAYFLITSTLPNNINKYNFDTSDPTHSENTYEDYYYMLSDQMSDGITYNKDAAIYMDKEGTKALDKQYYKFTTSSANTFQIHVNVKGLKADDRYKNATVLYTHYTGIVNENAKVSNEYEQNTITLDFNSNPSLDTDIGHDTATVYSYTFDLQVDKLDAHTQPLAGAKFGIYNGATWIKVQKANTVDGVDYYYLDPGMTTDATDTGYIVTSATGKFVINGLDDEITYVLKEEAAPENYNPIEPISFKIEASYNAATGKISILADNSTFINNLNDQSGFESDIINRKKVILPSTGGIGTILFRIVGGLLMIVAVVYLLLGTKRKSKKEL